MPGHQLPAQPRLPLLPPAGAEKPPEKLHLLKGITGYAEPGVLTALMGGSGAGKTTLMDVIAGRKTIGDVEGEIVVNGRPKEQRSWSRVVGYVEQADVHSPGATVEEALWFSARLRLPQSVSDEQVGALLQLRLGWGQRCMPCMGYAVQGQMLLERCCCTSLHALHIVWWQQSPVA
jgi:predicted ABC-type transport system involved in lysophospholipase L1 biosynthesis ATPase subunit